MFQGRFENQAKKSIANIPWQWLLQSGDPATKDPSPWGGHFQSLDNSSEEISPRKIYIKSLHLSKTGQLQICQTWYLLRETFLDGCKYTDTAVSYYGEQSHFFFLEGWELTYRPLHQKLGL